MIGPYPPKHDLLNWSLVAGLYTPARAIDRLNKLRFLATVAYEKGILDAPSLEIIVKYCDGREYELTPRTRVAHAFRAVDRVLSRMHGGRR